MKKGETSNRQKLERKTIERNRRNQMKELRLNLVSLIPSHHFNPPKDFLSAEDQLEQTANYIKQLKERVEELKNKKTQILPWASRNESSSQIHPPRTQTLPVVKLRDLGSRVEVILISQFEKTFKMSQVISILQEGGAELVTANTSQIGDKIFHTIHAQVKVSRVGIDTSSIGERIQELIS